jgi:hypothetical protein
LPLNELLDNSFYYPSSHFDGGVIKYYSKEIQSFIYCDYGVGKNNLLNELDTFYGYNIVGSRPVKKEELIPSGWKMEIPPNIDMQRYYMHKNFIKSPFAYWAVYERKPEFDKNHGRKRFSLLYIGGEGVATYQALYWANKKSAKALAIIKPGHGFGGNWANFERQDGPLGWVVLNNKSGQPDIIFYLGDNLDWEGFKLIETISPYYFGADNDHEPPSGEVTIWKRE